MSQNNTQQTKTRNKMDLGSIVNHPLEQVEGNDFYSYKIFNDLVHGHLKVPQHCLEFIDTPQFQRLRYLKQLGTTYFVFPGASHNRFEHCIGVGYLAGKMVNTLRKNQPELEITDRDAKLVSIAGLIHDLGHGPFSHSFENFVHTYGDPKFSHEEMGLKILDRLIDANGLDYERDDINFIKDLVEGIPTRTNNREKRFLFDIVANKRSSVDVDKFDYLARDTHHIGMKSSYDFSRLMKFNRVIDNEICFEDKEAYVIYEMFQTRYTMHKQVCTHDKSDEADQDIKVYTHKVGKSIEYMISDALRLADSHFHILDALNDADEFCGLTDSILERIELSKAQELEASRNLIRRIRKRQLYKFVGQQLLASGSRENITPADIVSWSRGNSLKEEDVIVDISHINYAMKGGVNPVDRLHFYNKARPYETKTVAKDEVSLLIPNVFEEKYVKIFVRNPENALEAKEGFTNYLIDRGYNPNTLLLPSPNRANKKRSRSDVQ